MGATTIANKKQGRIDNRKVVEADVTFSNSYATGGDTVSIGALGLKGVTGISLPSHDLITRKAVPNASSRIGVTVQLAGASTAPKLTAWLFPSTEVSPGDLSGVTIRVRFFGF